MYNVFFGICFKELSYSESVVGAILSLRRFSVETIFSMQMIAIIFVFGQAAMRTVESPFIYAQADDAERVHAFSPTFATRNAAYMTGSLLTGVLSDFFSTKYGDGAVSIRCVLILISLMNLLVILPLCK